MRRSLEAVTFDVDGYDVAWQEYLTCGGFPRAVAEQIRDGQVSKAYVKDLQASLLTDVDADAPPESIPRLLSELEQRGSSPLNVTAAAETLGYRNRPTLDRRLDRLVATFAALRCPQRNDDSNIIIIGSQPKVYLSDPLIAWLPSHLRGGLPLPDMTRLSEMTVGVTLDHVLDDLDEGRVIAGKYNAGVLATRSMLDVTEAVWAVPAPLVYLLLR